MKINMQTFSKKMIFILLVIIAIFVVSGCAKTRRTAKSDAGKTASDVGTGSRSSEAKGITDIGFGSDGNIFNIYIRGNRLLPYTSVKQASPAALFLYFTDTALYTDKRDLIVNNDMIETIRAVEVTEKGREAVKFEVLLNKNFPNILPYIISRDGPGLKISFKRGDGVFSTEEYTSDTRSGSFENNRGTSARNMSQKNGSGVASVSAASVLANRLDSVYAARFDDGLKVFVGANGMITKYKSYTSANPPQIVFDLFDLKSPYGHEKVIPVNSPWVRMVRYQSYADRVSLILETYPQYLNAYSASPVDNGLMVHVGQGYLPRQVPGTDFALPNQVQFNINSDRPLGLNGSGKSAPISSESGDRVSYRTSSPQISEQPENEADYTKPAHVNQIDIVKEDAGKSALMVETSRPVKYEIRRIGDKKLEVRLFNTQIPDDLQRPLTSGDAMEQITPVMQNPGNSSINIDIREDVPYSAEQSGQQLALRFAALTNPPPPPPAPERVAETPIPSSEPAVPAPMVASGATQYQIQPLPVTPPSVPVQPTMPSTPSADLKLDIKEDSSTKYTGEKIALDFYETDIKNVFRILREVSNMNFAVDKDVSGKVTLTLAEPVPWDQVLDLVLKMNKLGKSVDGNVIRIATAKTLDEEEKIRRDQKKSEMEANVVKKQLEPFITEYISVNYSDAEKEVLPHLKEILTKDRGDSKEKGTASVDKRTNMVIITDTADIIRRSKELIEKLDRVTPQVVIEARIVEATTNFSREIGTTWGSKIGILNDDTNAGIGPERGYNMFGGTYGYDMAVNLPITSTSGGILGFNFMRIAGTPFSLDAKLLAMETKGDGKIVSAPKVVTLDNKTATIKQGVRYPYNKRDESGNTVTVFEEVDLKLEVTPHVTPDNRISMLISIIKKDLGDKLDTGQRAFTNKEAKTELLINDGETVVIGGIIKETENLTNSGIPGLSKIPLLGWLFKAKSSEDRKEELLIFITPRIVQLEQKAVQS